MTLFEYLAIAFSLLFSFSAMRLVGGLPHAVDPDRRYPIHLCFVFIHLVGTAAVFWAFWSYRDVSWTFPRFLLALAGPSLIYFGACTLIPEAPATIASWRTHYYTVHKKYFLCVCLWAAVVAVTVTILVQMPLAHPARAAQAGAFAAAIIGALSDSQRVHAGIAALFISGIAIGIFSLLMQPGSLAQ